MAQIKAYINTDKGVKIVMIYEVAPNLTEKKLEKLSESFNEETRVMEFVGGVTYYFKNKGGRAIKSSSLDELFEMYKAYKLGLVIPERKCFFNKK